ncbi:uncharacterized protein FIESC28_08135 [Fusarium coffeatum]|uniref:F-box domain-containing protein n=1 Tax=Fusarium coffeatum TaxID=231269 RepID=A0A366R8M3_9HYPO|nr:uncharacterized protein FIESC28_08135 [Fusarium coffeatum]RBR13507.1 hypothetical protein FIESC28_08135 [Fusarium coffeatum]
MFLPQLLTPPKDKKLSLMDLPEEILEQIVLDVADQDRRALYSAVVYVNKRLRRIASPHVARHLPIHCMNPEFPATPMHILMHLSRHPEQAKNIRTLVSDSDEGKYWRRHGWRNYPESPTHSENFERIVERAKETCPELAKYPQWCLHLRNGSADASVALLLAWCTRIVKLDCKLYTFSPGKIEHMTLQLINIAVKEMRDGTGPSLHPLARLEHVVLRTSSQLQRIAFAAPFFYLPKLKFLATSGLGTDSDLRDVHDDRPVWFRSFTGGYVTADPALYMSKFPVGTSPIETLIVDRAWFSSCGFLVLVRACKRLKKLAIYNDYFTKFNNRRSLEENNRVAARLEDLSKAIAYHSSSLEEVTLRLEQDPYWRDFHHYHRTTAPLTLFDCLKDMQRLKRLKIHLEFLYRRVTRDLWDYSVVLETNRLPPTLEHLVLERYDHVHATLMHGELYRFNKLLEQCGPGSKFSKLQSLTLPFRYERSRGCPLFEQAEDLEVLAASKGVQLLFQRNPRDYSVPQVPKPYPPLRQRIVRLN